MKTGNWWMAGALGLALLASPVEAQYDRPPPPAAWALEGVTLVGVNGTRQTGLTLVVRNGLIEAMGAEVAVPPDAKLLEGDSLVVVPGFVDAHGVADVTWPEARDVPDPDEVRSWDPPRSRQGFLPHRRVADHLTATGAALSDRRAHGVVASRIPAATGMAPGRGAVIVHRDAATPWGLVEMADGGLDLSFRSAQGVYPSQLFGVIAFLRQAFMDAERYGVLRAQQGDGGFVPPGWDPDYEALLSLTSGSGRAYFSADSDEDIRRALDFAEQFDFRLAIVGGEEAWKLAPELARREVPVVVSLDFPEPDDWDPEADTIDAELEPGALRERERIEAAWANAGRLHEAGVTVALGSGGGEADLLEGLRTVVENGLAIDAALRAVTSAPAELLGIPAVTRVAAGGPATFTVLSGELADEETTVRYTFVEGALTEGAGAGGGAGGDEAPASDISGTWSGEISVGGEEAAFTLTVTQAEDGSLTGTMSAAEMPTSSFTGNVSGNTVTIRIQPEGMPDPIELSGTLSEDGMSMTGEGSSPFGEMEFSATKNPGAGWAALFGGGR